MKIRIVETIAKSGFPHGLRGVLPRACLPAGEAVVTGQGVETLRPDPSYSLAAASGDASFADVPFPPPSREGGECCPAPISGMEAALVLAFVDTWISPPPYIAPAPRDFTFKAVIGEPEW